MRYVLRLIALMAFFAPASPSAAQETDVLIVSKLCVFPSYSGSEPFNEIISYAWSVDGQPYVIGDENGVIQERKGQITILSEDTVYQLTPDSKVTLLKNGTSSIGTCNDVSSLIIEVASARQVKDRLNEAEFAALHQMVGRVTTERDRLAAALAHHEAAALAGRADANAALRARLAEAWAAKLAAQRTASDRLSEAERRAALLDAANRQLEIEEARSAQSQRQIEVLNRQVTQLRGQLDQLQALLDLAIDKDTASRVRIETLGSDLNAALARAAIEAKRRAELEAAERQR